MRPQRSTAGTVLLVLFVFWPFVLAAVVIVVFAVVFFVAMVVQAFQEGFAEGCASLAALIGIPSLGLLWLSAALKLFGRKAPVPTRRIGPPDPAWEQWKREHGW